ncbi:unnamed protein product, partial [Symbiodinium sp. KB8]
MKKYNCTAVEAEKIAEEKEKEAEAARENDRKEVQRRQKDEEEDEEDASDDDREGGPEGQLTRGQRRKMKKIKAEYADQDEEDRQLALKMLGIKKAAQEEEAKDTKGAECPGEYRGKKDAQQASEGAHEKEAAEKPGKPVLSREEVLSKRAKARAEKKE